MIDLRTLYPLIFLFILLGCREEIDDTNKLYSTNLTTVTGIVLTEGGKVPVKGLKLNLDRVISDELTYSHRNILNFETDSTGHFKIEFYATDYEIYYGCVYNINYLDNSSKYIKPTYREFSSIYLNHRRDTVINKRILLPTRAYLRIKIVDNTKNIGFNTYYRCGDNNRIGGSKSIDSIINEMIVEAAGNQINYIGINKRENSINPTIDSIFVPVGDTITYTVH